MTVPNPQKGQLIDHSLLATIIDQVNKLNDKVFTGESAIWDGVTNGVTTSAQTGNLSIITNRLKISLKDNKESGGKVGSKVFTYGKSFSNVPIVTAVASSNYDDIQTGEIISVVIGNSDGDSCEVFVTVSSKTKKTDIAVNVTVIGSVQNV